MYESLINAHTSPIAQYTLVSSSGRNSIVDDPDFDGIAAFGSGHGKSSVGIQLPITVSFAMVARLMKSGKAVTKSCSRAKAER